MALSFQIELLSSSSGDKIHFYRAVLDGGDRTLHLLLDETGQKILLSTPEGKPLNGTAMSVESGDIIRPAPEELSSDFSLTAAHLRSDFLKKGVAPSRIRKFFG